MPTESAAELEQRPLTLLDNAVQFLRVCVRVPLLFVWTLAWFGARMAVLPIALIQPAAERALRKAILRAWAGGTCAMLRVTITVRGPIPDPPYVLVSNHLGYFDTIVYARLLGCVFVSMAEVDAWPLIGTLARGLNTLFVDRAQRRDTARVNHEIREVLEKGHGLLLFPESTTTYGDQVLKFHGPLLQPAIDLHRPVHYAAISYTASNRDDANAICWVDDTPFGTHALRLLRLARFDAKVRFGDSPVAENDRKQMAASLHTAVETLLFDDAR